MGFITKILTYLNPYLMYWKAIAIVSGAAVCFLAGFHLHTLQDASAALDEQNKAIADYKKGDEFRNTVNTAYVHGQQSRDGELKATQQQLKVYRAKHSINAICPATSDILPFLNQ